MLQENSIQGTQKRPPQGHKLKLLLASFVFNLSTLSTLARALHLSAASTSPAAATEDPCTALYSKLLDAPRFEDDTTSLAFVRPEDLRTCQDAVSDFDEDRDTSNLENIIKYFQNFYGPLHIAKWAPDSRMPSRYDVVAQLKGLANQNWTSRAVFYDSISQVIDGLKDGHAGLDFPRNAYLLPLNLVAVLEEGKQVVYVAPERLQNSELGAAAEKHFNFTQSNYFGSRVLQIDGQDALRHLLTFARRNATGYLNAGQRFNSLFPALKWSFTWDPQNPRMELLLEDGAFSSRLYHPGKSHLEILLERNNVTESVQVPWMVSVPLSTFDHFRDLAAYHRRAGEIDQVKSRPRAAEASRTKHRRYEPLRGLVPRVLVSGLEELPQVTGGIDFESQDSGDSLSSSPAPSGAPSPALWPVFVLEDSVSCVVVIHSFELNEDSEDTDQFFLQETLKAGEIVRELNCSRLIIDLRSNSGGNLRWAQWLLQWVVGTRRFRGKYRQTDFMRFLADTDFVGALRNESIGSYNCELYTNVGERPYVNDTCPEFFYPTVQLQTSRRGVRGRYSRFLKLDVAKIETILGVPSVAPLFGGAKLVLLSDGKCFSACGTFAVTLRERFRVPLVTIGGIQGEPLAFQGGGGGFSAVHWDLWQTWGSTDLQEREDAPEDLRGSFYLYLKHSLGYYHPRYGAPIEFMFIGGNKRLPFTTQIVGNHTAIYNALASLL